MKVLFLKSDLIERYFFIALIFLSVILFGSIIILASVPPVSKDALTHHLAVPKLYLNNGGIYEIPSIIFSYYPMNLDLLYLIPLYFGNDIFPKFIHFLFGVLTASSIFIYLRQRINNIYAFGGGLFFLSIPIVVKLSISVYVDLGLLFFTTVSLLFLLEWSQNTRKPIFLISAAVFCGLAMGTKYNGLVSLLIISAFVPIISARQPKDGKYSWGKVTGYTVAFGLIALAVYSPWMIRNYIWTNNPLFPLYDGWFNIDSQVTKSALSVFTIRNLIYGESWWEMALLPIRIFFQGQDGIPKYFDGRLNPFLLLLPLFSFYRIKCDSPIIAFEKKLLIAFATLFFLFAFFSTSMRIRYILPIIAPLVILSVYGTKNVVDWIRENSNQKRKHIVKGLISVAVLIAFLLNANYLYHQFKLVKPLEYLSGKITRDQYIEKFRPEYAAMQYINKKVSQDAKILFFFLGRRAYYCDRNYIFDVVHHRSMLQKTLKQAGDSKDLYHELKNEGISHLLIRNDIFNRWVTQDFNEGEKSVIKGFFRKHINKLYEKNGYSVFGFKT